MTIALDTNILVYAEGVNGAERQHRVEAAIERWSGERWSLAAQVGLELYRVLMRKGGRSATEAREQVARWLARCAIVATDETILRSAMDLVVAHRIAPQDAIILASAASAGCDLLLSEDMQDGFTCRGVTVRNPFSQSSEGV